MACWLRAPHLGSHGLWLDELGTLWTIRADTASGCLDRVWAVQGQTAAYYLLLRATTHLFGESETTLRLPSLLFGLLVPLLAFVALAPVRRFGPRAGIAAAITLGVNVQLVFYSHQARPYALAALGTLLAYLGLSRATRSGRPLDRALLWGGALLAAYAHTLFAPVLLAAGLGALAAQPARYSRKTLLIDSALAALLAIPFALTAVHVFSRRGTLDWARGDASIFLLLVPGVLAVLCIAATFALARWANGPNPREAAPPPAGSRTSTQVTSRALLCFELTVVLIPIALVIAMGGLGTNLYHTRYLLLAAIGVALLAARLIGRLPWPAAAIALSCLVLAPGTQIPRQTGFWIWPQWREAAQALDDLGPTADDPIILRPGFVESDKVLDPPYALDPRIQDFVSSPLEHPGRRNVPRQVVILPFTRGTNERGREVYFERMIAARLSESRRFFLVANAETQIEFARWLQVRFPRKFARSVVAGPFRDLGGSSGSVTLYTIR